MEVEEGPARKRFLSKFFRDPKGELYVDKNLKMSCLMIYILIFV
jgi:hypothetical protein